MESPTAEVWQGFAATHRRFAALSVGGLRARLTAALLFALGALIAVVLLPLLAGLVVVCLVLVCLARLRGAVARAASGFGGPRDAEGRRNVRVRNHEAPGP